MIRTPSESSLDPRPGILDGDRPYLEARALPQNLPPGDDEEFRSCFDSTPGATPRASPPLKKVEGRLYVCALGSRHVREIQGEQGLIQTISGFRSKIAKHLSCPEESVVLDFSLRLISYKNSEGKRTYEKMGIEEVENEDSKKLGEEFDALAKKVHRVFNTGLSRKSYDVTNRSSEGSQSPSIDVFSSYLRGEKKGRVFLREHLKPMARFLDAKRENKATEEEAWDEASVSSEEDWGEPLNRSPLPRDENGDPMLWVVRRREAPRVEEFEGDAAPVRRAPSRALPEPRDSRFEGAEDDAAPVRRAPSQALPELRDSRFEGSEDDAAPVRRAPSQALPEPRASCFEGAEDDVGPVRRGPSQALPELRDSRFEELADDGTPVRRAPLQAPEEPQNPFLGKKIYNIVDCADRIRASMLELAEEKIKTTKGKEKDQWKGLKEDLEKAEMESVYTAIVFSVFAPEDLEERVAGITEYMQQHLEKAYESLSFFQKRITPQPSAEEIEVKALQIAALSLPDREGEAQFVISTRLRKPELVRFGFSGTSVEEMLVTMASALDGVDPKNLSNKVKLRLRKRGYNVS